MKYYSAIKNNEIMLSAATWMDLEGIMLSEINGTEKDKYCMIAHVECKNNKLVNITTITKKSRLTDIESNLVVTSVEREGGRSHKR